VQPGLPRYRKEREGILSAHLMPPKIPEIRTGRSEQTRPANRKHIRHGMRVLRSNPRFAVVVRQRR
jgi:hypothetical protein